MMKSVTYDEVNRIRMCNAQIRNENHILRCTLRNLSADPFSECSKVLATVVEHCTKKKFETKSGAPDPCCKCCPDTSSVVCPPKRPTKTSKPCPPICPSPPCRFSFPDSRTQRHSPKPRQTCCHPCCCPSTSPTCAKPRCVLCCMQGPTNLSRSRSPRPRPSKSNSSTCCKRAKSHSPCKCCCPSSKCKTSASSYKPPYKCSCILCRLCTTLPPKNYCSNHGADGPASFTMNNKAQDQSSSCSDSHRSPSKDCRGDGCTRPSYTSKFAESQNGGSPRSFSNLFLKTTSKPYTGQTGNMKPSLKDSPLLASSCSDSHRSPVKDCRGDGCARNCSKPSYASKLAESQNGGSPRSYSNLHLKTSCNPYPGQTGNITLSLKDSPLLDENESAAITRPSAKILGELAFQLERRILDYVFGMDGSKRRRFYGYTVNNICHMMHKECKNFCGKDDTIRKSELAFRLKSLLIGLRKVGYNIKEHGDFAQLMINKYGLLPCPPDSRTIEEFGLLNANYISGFITKLAVDEFETDNLQILLKSLQYLSKCDGRPLFVW